MADGSLLFWICHNFIDVYCVGCMERPNAKNKWLGLVGYFAGGYVVGLDVYWQAIWFPQTIPGYWRTVYPADILFGLDVPNSRVCVPPGEPLN